MNNNLDIFQKCHRGLEFNSHSMHEDILRFFHDIKDEKKKAVFEDLMNQHREVMIKLMSLDESILKFKL